MEALEMDLVSTARRINDGMAQYAVQRLAGVLGGLDGVTVVVLGLAYRAGVKEARHSSAFGLAAALTAGGARVFVHDPLFSAEEIRAVGLEPPASWPTACDALIVQAWHEEYAALDLASFAGLRAVMDTRAALDAESVRRLGMVYVGIGR
jgi:UDP-N-acetyl-D-mannosaminuronate dehydrogenase